MAVTLYSRRLRAENPLGALQRKARKHGIYVLRAQNFSAYRDDATDRSSHVLVYDATGNRLAGPFDLVAADVWLYSHVRHLDPSES